MKCQDCGEDTDEPVKLKVGKKTLKLCPDCADARGDEEEVEKGAISAMKGMMEYKG